MADLLLDPQDQDLYFTASGGGRLTPNTAYTCAQTLMIGLSMFLGEWFLDTSKGIPYFQELFFLVPNDDTVRAIFSQHILANPYVASLRSLDLEVDRGQRTLSLNFEVLVIDGSIVSLAEAVGLVDGQITVNGVGVVVNGVPVVIG